jgi:hypothetical protein
VQVFEGRARETGKCTETLQEAYRNTGYTQEVMHLTFLMLILTQADFAPMLFLLYRVTEKSQNPVLIKSYFLKKLQSVIIGGVENNFHPQALCSLFVAFYNSGLWWKYPNLPPHWV